MSRRSKRLLVALSVAVVLAGGAAGLPALADSGTQQVGYHGYEIEVPASWRVVDLDADPAACVRFYTPAVYLGAPGEVSDCPADISGGRTAGLVISPLDARSAATATADTATTTTETWGRAGRVREPPHPGGRGGRRGAGVGRAQLADRSTRRRLRILRAKSPRGTSSPGC